MRVYCTRPKNPDEPLPHPHPNEIKSAELLGSGELEQYICKVCGMPLVIKNQYIVEQELGRGGVGKTFLALDLHSTGQSLTTKKRRVLKQFYPARYYSDSSLTKLRELFRREGETLEELKHLQIPRFYAFLDVSACPDQRFEPGSSRQLKFFYLVQEYIEGQDLEQECQIKYRNGEVYTEEEIRQLLRELLDVLKYIHEKNYIHRDIKPSNIIRSSLDRKLYLIDFGAVKDIIPRAQGEILNNETVIYSAGYTPIEFKRGNVYPSSDLYALAATCVRLLLNPQLIDSDDSVDLNQLVSLIENGEWKDLTQVSNPLKDVLDRMLKTTPSERFGTAQEIINQLVPAVPTAENRRRKGLLVGGAIATIALVSGIILALRPSDRSSQLPGTPASPADLIAVSAADAGLTDRFSQGGRLLLPADPNNVNEQAAATDKTDGIKAFAAGNYNGAIAELTTALQNNRNDPETRIYLNNARVAQQNPVKIAVSVPIGSQLDVAKEILRGVAQAQDEFNQNANQNANQNSSGNANQNAHQNRNSRSNLQARGILVTIINDENKPEIAEAVANTLVKDPSILAVVGHNASDASLAAAPVYQKGGLVMVSPTSFADGLSERGSFIFRAVPKPNQMPYQLAIYARTVAQKSRLLVCYDSAAKDNNSFKENFVATFVNQGGTALPIDCDFSKRSTAWNPETIIAQALQQNADSILLAPHVDRLSDAIEVAIANQNQGKRLALFSSASLYTNIVLQKGQTAVAGLVFSAPWQSELPIAQPFRTRAIAEWGGDVNWRTALSYDATIAIIQGLQQIQLNGTDTRKQLADQLKILQVNNGSLGQFKFLQSGDREGSPVLVQVTPDSTGKLDFKLLKLLQ